VEIPWPTGDGVEPLALLGQGTLQAPLEPFEVRAGEQMALGAFGEARPLTGDGSVGDCNRYDARSLDEVGIAAEWLDPSTVTLRASDHSPCAVFAVPTAPLTTEVVVPYAVARGRGARACLWDEHARTCWSEGSSEGAHGELRLAQPGGVDGLQLFVYGDASDAPALVRYGPVVVRDFVASGTAVVPDRLSGPIEVGPGVRHLEATGGGRTSALGEWGGLENCHAFDARTADEVGLGLVRNGPEVELRADAHSACLIAPVDAGPGDVLELSLEHRTLAGGAARVCVWMDGPNQCAETEALVHSAGWERLDVPVTVAPGTTAVRLYLYADGLDNGTTTVVQYRHVNLRRADHTRFSITPADDTSAPEVLAERATPGRWHVTVNGLDGPALLTLHESHAQGWRIDGLPTGWTADPVTVDGWAMGWLITGSVTVRSPWPSVRPSTFAPGSVGSRWRHGSDGGHAPGRTSRREAGEERTVDGPDRRVPHSGLGAPVADWSPVARDPKSIGVDHCGAQSPGGGPAPSRLWNVAVWFHENMTSQERIRSSGCSVAKSRSAS
jgi:hypothetical protein